MKKIFAVLMSLTIFSSVFCMASNSDSISAETLNEVIINDTDIGNEINQVSYTGSWGSGPNNTCYNNTEHYSTASKNNWNNALPKVSMNFKGTKVSFHGKKANGHGIYQVYIDGVDAGKYDAFASPDQNQVAIFESGTLAYGEHNIVVQPAREKNASSSKDDIHFDFFKVYSPSDATSEIKIKEGDNTLAAGFEKQLTAIDTATNKVLNNISWEITNKEIASIDASGKVIANKTGTTKIKATIPNTTISSEVNLEVTGNDISDYATLVDDMVMGNGLFEFEFKSTWGTPDQGYPALFYNGTNHWSTNKEYKDTPASAVFRFTGEGAEIYGNLQDDNCIYDIYLDGAKVATFDAYAKTRKTQQLIYTTGKIADGEHSIEVKTTTNKNVESTKTAFSISIDYARVFHKAIPIADIIVPDTVMLDAGATQKVDAKTKPHYATDHELVWTSENPSVATVDQGGSISGVTEGKTKIRVESSDQSISKVILATVRNGDYVVRSSFGSANEHHLQSAYDKVVNLQQDHSSDFGWLNDRISTKIVSWTKNKNVNDLNITSSDFTNDTGSVFSKDNVTINHLKETEAYTGRGGGKGLGQNAQNSQKFMVPDIIYKEGNISLENEKVLSSWVSIDIPKDTEPGIYRGTFIINATNLDNPIELVYEFEVIGILQPEADDFAKGIELWEYPYAVAKHYGLSDDELYGERHLELLKPHLEEYRAMGGDTITTAMIDYPWDRNNPYDYPSTIKWTRKTDGTYEYDFTHFDKWVQLNIDQGIDNKLKCFSMSPYHPMRYFDEASGEYKLEYNTGSGESGRVSVGSDLWKERWGDFLDAFIPHLEEKGWFDMAYTAMDEVGANHINAVSDLVKKHPSSSGKTLKVSAAVNVGNTSKDVIMKVDDISLELKHVEHGGSWAEKALAKERRELGLSTSFYTCTGIYPNSFTLSDPGESAWTLWYSATQDMDGYLRWAYDNWIKDPYTSLMHHSWEAGDTMLIYPDENPNAENPQFHSTPRWEKMKEGKRDIEKLYYLQNNYPELKEEVTELFDSLGRKEGLRNSFGGMYAASQKDKEYLNLEVQRMRDGLNAISKKALDLKSNLNTTTLVSKLEEAEAMNEALYTPDSYHLLKAAILNGKTVLGSATQQLQIDDALQSLNEAIASLTYRKADYAKVEDALKQIPKDLSLYTTQSVSELNDFVTTIDYDKNISEQATVDEYATTILNRINSLVLKLQNNQLQEAIEQAKALKESDFTSESWATLKEALAKAANTLTNATTQKEIDDMNMELEKAIKDLVPVSEDLIYQTLTSEDGTISVSGFIHVGVELSIKEYTNISDVTSRIKDADFLKNNTIHQLYDIKLMKDGQPYQPLTTLDVTIKTSADINERVPLIVHIAEDGKINSIVSSVSGNMITFKTNHFSDYGVISKNIVMKPSTNANKKDTNTGYSTNLSLLLMLLSISGYTIIKKFVSNNALTK